METTLLFTIGVLKVEKMSVLLFAHRLVNTEISKGKYEDSYENNRMKQVEIVKYLENKWKKEEN